MDCRIITVNKMKNRFNLKYSIALVLFTVSLQAQETFPGDVPDIQEAPLDTWLFPMTLVGIALLFYFVKKKIQLIK